MEREKRNLEQEVARLLSSRDWQTDTGAYLRSAEVCIAIRPYPSEESVERVHVPLAVLPLKSDVALLKGLDISLVGPARCKGTLNRRGQATFFNIPSGTYRAELAVPVRAGVAIKPPTLKEVLAGISLAFRGLAEMALAQTEPDRPKFTNADGSLEVSVEEFEEQLWLTFEGDSAIWANQLAICRWQPSDDDDEARSDYQGYCVVLEADGDKASAGLLLDIAPGLGVRSQPYPVSELTPEFAAMFRASVKRAATGHDLHAWRKFAARPDLHPELRAVIEEAVTEK